MVDLGLMRMKRVMAEKQARYQRIVQCKAQGSCPELVMRESDGPAECIDGKSACPSSTESEKPEYCSGLIVIRYTG